MAKQRPKRSGLQQETKAAKPGRSNPQGHPPLSRPKLWLFRFMALIGGPALFLGVLEVTLRIAGYGYPTAFLLPTLHKGDQVFVQNNQFGWPYFGARMARLPEPFLIARTKQPQTIRVFFFGESAAKGEPQPAFGPARMLQSILSLRHPGVRFEVVNVAMTAINSHAIRSIAGDCTRGAGDVWVIYMGNNEVVGPFGAGTVFGQQTPPLWMIRSVLALKSTRTGQLFDSWLAKPLKADGGEWRGMKMFLEQQVRADDPRMQSVYHHFEQNLRAVIDAGRRSGARVVVSTVAVNLRDCAPFGSEHRGSLSASELSEWEVAYKRGREAQEAGKTVEAASHFLQAARIDETYAELRFRQGQCASALQQREDARKHFESARDLDTLRFRCDSRVNELIRQVTADFQGQGVLLADSEQAFAAASPDALPGGDLFYEHVHPTFEGNYLLAATMAHEVERLLPTNLLANATVAWPTKGEVAARLGWSDWSELAVLNDVLVRIKAPPFTSQLNHEFQVSRLTGQMEGLLSARQPGGLAAARATMDRALRSGLDDAVLHNQLAVLREASGDLEGAIASSRRGLELVPNNAQAWLHLGMLLIRGQNLAEASRAFARASELDPADALARQNLAQSLWLRGEREAAFAEYRQAVKWQPQLTTAWLGLAHGLEESGRKAEAEECIRRALETRSPRSADRVALARFCRSRGWRDAAATNYNAAMRLSAADGHLCIEAGQNLLMLKRNAEALSVLGEAVRLLPDSVQARTLFGSLLGQQGQPVEAERQFRAALNIDPAHIEARLNLGIALMSQGRNSESLTCLQEVLRQSPTNELAAKYVERLRATPGALR